jgi:hypothetical protein
MCSRALFFIGFHHLACKQRTAMEPNARQKEKWSVLTLGWEFPPRTTGGLGPAFFGLTSALSKFADIHILLPKAEPGFALRGATVQGMQQSLPTAENISLPSAMQEVAVGPYPINLPTDVLNASLTPEEISRLLHENDIYGPHILRKVQAFALASLVAAKHYSFDIIHAHDWVTFPAALLLKQHFKKPLVLHVHSLETDRVHPEVRNAVYFIEQTGMQAADRVLPVSQFTGQSIVRLYGIPPDKIVPVHNAPDEAIIPKVRALGQGKRMLFLGRVTHQKGPDTLFRVVQRLAPYIPGLKVYVAGVGDQLDNLQNRVHAAGLTGVFEFTGFISKKQVQKLLTEVDAFFMPSVSEPFGLSAIEAAQYGIPCVISKQCGVAEVLHHCLKADFWDVEKLADYLYGVLHYEGLRRTMTTHTRHDLAQISWAQSARQVLQVYKTILDPNASKPDTV